jgi:RNA polymerase sigma factor (TIGR02999 family)
MDLDDDITGLVARARAGGRGAADALLRRIYADLCAIARARLRAEHADTLGTHALVHEAWLSMARHEQASFSSRGHYFAYAAKAMRNILVDRARRRLAAKRQLEPGVEPDDSDAPLELVAMDQALQRLGQLSPRLAKVAELRLFAGLSSIEIGALLGTTERTVERDWLKARAVLAESLESAP